MRNAWPNDWSRSASFWKIDSHGGKKNA